MRGGGIILACGLIRAGYRSCDNLIAHGSGKAFFEQVLIRFERKTSEVQEVDILNICFSI
jgi:hypothetical protein